MKVQVFDNAQQAGQAIATIIAAQILKKPDSVLGFATGASPIPAYNTLVEWHKGGILDFSKVRTFNLDEYVSLGPDHKESYYHFMYEHLFGHVNIDPKNVHIPNGLARDLDAECDVYELAIAQAGGIDLQLLGIGHNGHIGFNEPDNSFATRTHVTGLTQSTIQANLYNFENENMPDRALTMGIGTIMEAKAIVMIVTGSGKAPAVSRMLSPDIDPQSPATILKCHSDVTVMLDKAAASLL